MNRWKLARPGMRPVIAGLTAIVALLVASVAVASANSHHSDSSRGWHDHPSHHESKAEHVLLLSVDGLHQSDLQWYVGKHPHSALASLVLSLLLLVAMGDR